MCSSRATGSTVISAFASTLPVRAAGRARGRAAVVQRQVEGEGAALSVHAGEADFAAEEHGQFAADRQAETGAAVLARGAGVGLLERLEDQPLLLRRHADAGVFDGERDDLLGIAEHGVIRAPAVRGQGDADVDMALSGELDGVGEQVLEDLLQPLRVAVHRTWQVGREVER